MSTIKQKLVYLKNKQDYTNRKNDISDISVCFIEETGEIYTHGNVFPNLSKSVTNNNANLDWGKPSIIAKVGNKDITVTMPDNPNTDTKNTAGSTNKASEKLFLVGARSQAANPQTYSNVNCYIDTDNCLYSNGKLVLTEHQSLDDYALKADVPTNWISRLITGTSNADENTEATNGNVWLKLIENGEVRDTHNIVGDTGINVTSDKDGKITISGTNPGDGILTLKVAGSNSKTFTANQSTNVEFDVTAEKLGLSKVMTFVGESTTDPLSTKATVSGHTTWKTGEVVYYGNKEYVIKSSTNSKENWIELGDISVSGGGTDWGDSITVNGITLTIPNMPSLDDLGYESSGNTWRGIYVNGDSKIGTDIDSKAINFVAGTNISLSYSEPKNQNYNTLTINGPDLSNFASSGHNHDDIYVKKSGDTMTGTLHLGTTSARITGLAQHTAGTSNAVTFVEFYKANSLNGQIGYHNTGDSDKGAVYIIPTAFTGNGNPWGGSQGLYMGGNQTFTWYNNTILHSGNSYIDGNTITINGKSTTWSDTNTTYTADNGITLSDTTFSASLTSTTKLKGEATSTQTYNNVRTYPVSLDSNGKLAVVVPWSSDTANKVSQALTWYNSKNESQTFDGSAAKTINKLSLTSTASTWIGGQQLSGNSAINITDATNTGSYWPWIRQTNTDSKKWFSVGVLNTSLYILGSTTERTENSADYSWSFNVKDGIAYGTYEKANKWTTARTLTIGKTGKSVDGSKDVSWSLSEIGAATSGHTHDTKIETTTDTNQINLTHGSKYKLTAGDTSYVFTMPSDNNTWKANSSSSEGYVKSGSGQANKVWKTDANGNPDWRNESTHTTTIETTTDTNQITLAYNKKYKLTAGGTSYVFTMPSDNADNLYTSIGDWMGKVNHTYNITVNGNAETYYPVMITLPTDKRWSTYISVYKNLGTTTAQYTGNHSNGTSSMWLMYEARSTYWDGNGGFIRTLYRSMPYADLCAETNQAGSGVGALVLWLRGGGTIYYVAASDSVTVTCYLTTTNVGSSSYPVNLAPRTTTGNLGIYNTTFSYYNADAVDGYHAGNSSGSIPISNKTLNVDLNADLLDGKHASDFALSHSHPYIKYHSKTVSPNKGVRIQYPGYTPIIIGANRPNGDGQLVLVGSGYGAGGTVRNKFTELVSCGSYFEWSLPASDSYSTSIEIMHKSTQNDATIYVYCAGDVTFTDITSLTTDKQNHTLITTKNFGYTTSGKNYKVQLDSSNNLYVNVPWSDTNTDTKVTQEAVVASNYGNWRTIPFGASNSKTEGFTPETVTDQLFTVNTLEFQPSTGTLRTGIFKSTVTTGTAPLIVASTTKVTNLNADLLDGYHAGNASGNVPISNGTLNTNLNSDLLDGYHASPYALPYMYYHDATMSTTSKVWYAKITMNGYASWDKLQVNCSYNNMWNVVDIRHLSFSQGLYSLSYDQNGGVITDICYDASYHNTEHKCIIYLKFKAIQDSTTSHYSPSSSATLKIWSSNTDFTLTVTTTAPTLSSGSNWSTLEPITIVGTYNQGGTLYPNLNNTYDLGTSDKKWRNVYATTFNGNATTATTATNLASAPSLSWTNATSSSAGSTLTVTAGGKTSTAVTLEKVRYAYTSNRSEYTGRDTFIQSPKGGVLTTNGSYAGYLRIKMPCGLVNTMMSFYVDIYDYAENQIATYKIGGYNYSAGWYNVSAQCVSSYVGNYCNLTVRFGTLDDKATISIGESNTTWSYPQVVVRDVLLGYSGGTIANYFDSWTIDISTTAITEKYHSSSTKKENTGLQARYTYGFAGNYNVNFDCNNPQYMVYSDYGSGKTVSNKPQDWKYGTLLTLGDHKYRGINGYLNAQLMWDVQHNTENPGRLWFRTKDEITGWRGWTEIITANNISSYLTNLSPSLSWTDATSSTAGSTLTVTVGGKTSTAVTLEKVRYAYNADTVDGVHMEWSGQITSSQTSWLAAWTSDGSKIKAFPTSNFASSGHTHTYYWADQSTSVQQNSATTPQFGSVAINTAIDPNYKLKVNGACMATAFYESSDYRLKENIKSISDTFKEFTWKESGQKSYGLIAQELEEKYPELVFTGNNGYKTVNYSAALCMIVAKLENRIKELEEKLKEK